MPDELAPWLICSKLGGRGRKSTFQNWLLCDDKKFCQVDALNQIKQSSSLIIYSFKIVKSKDLDLVLSDRITQVSFKVRRKFFTLSYTMCTFEWFSIVAPDEIKVSLLTLLQSSIASTHFHCPCGLSSTNFIAFKNH